MIAGPFDIPICPPTGTINDICNGQRQQTLADVTVGENGRVSNVDLQRTIINHGWISNANLATGIVTGYIINQGTMADFDFRGERLTGGTLSGVITNTNGGTIKGAHLTAHTQISGGQLAGQITGDIEAPALLENLNVKPGSELSGIIIGDNVQLPDDVKLGERIRFANHTLLPNEVELIDWLPVLSNPFNCADQITLPARVDLTADILSPSDGILTAINNLPALTNDGLALTQDAHSGNLQLDIDTLHLEVQPMSLKRATDFAQMQVQHNQSIRFITDTGLEVLTQPVVQAPCELQAALESYGLPNFTVQTNGNLKIPAYKSNWYSVRPDFYADEVIEADSSGLSQIEPAMVNGVYRYRLVFTDGEGKQRQQRFSPAIAVPEALYASAQQVQITDGVVSFKLNGHSYRGIVGYLVTQSTFATNQLQVISQPDI